jgi:hypothetical protein
MSNSQDFGRKAKEWSRRASTAIRYQVETEPEETCCPIVIEQEMIKIS